MILVTGFEPFGGLKHNPSATLLERLPQEVGDHLLHKAIFPVDSAALPGVLRKLHALKPKAVLHLGLAEGRPLLSLERLAINLLDFERPDNRGIRWEDTPVIPGGLLALEARSPLKKSLRRLREARTKPFQGKLYLQPSLLLVAFPPAPGSSGRLRPPSS